MGVYINEDTQVHMTTTYTRHSKPKRVFSFVIKGMLISSALLTSIALGGVDAYASINPTITTTAIQQVEVNIEDEQALISNLNLAVKVMQENGWSVKRLTAIMDQLNTIEKRLFGDNGFKFTEELKKAILETERVVTANGGDGLMTLRGKNVSIIESIGRIKSKLGMTTTQYNATSPPVSKKGQGLIASLTENEVSVFIDGAKQFFPQSAVIIDGSTMVPLRAIFEKLGAEIKWHNETRTVTATKGDTEIMLTINSDQAYINGNQVQLTAKAQSVNGNTMVPLRFVSEALGGTVKWDGTTMTAYIESAKESGKLQVVNGITVKYGKHHYGVSNQKEYDQSMKIVDEALKGFDDVVFGGDNNEYYELFLEGERWSGDRRDRSDRNVGLKLAEGTIGDLVSAGVSKAEVIKASKASSIAIDLLRGKKDPLDGTPRSIYDALFLERIDCDPIAQTYSAVFDSLGFNTMIIGGSNHAEVLIQFDGKWWETASSSFRQVDVSNAIANGSYVISQPTDGTIIR